MKNNQNSTNSSYYRLHTQAVEDLVNASRENTPQYSKEELEKYRSSASRFSLPEMLKAVLIKAWFYGAVCYFSFLGLGMYAADQLDLFFIAAILMGMVTDLLVNRCLRFMEKTPGASRRYLMVTRRGATGFFLNLLYAFVLLFLVATIYSAINALLLSLSGGDSASLLGVEPVLFGLFATAADALLLACRRLLMTIVADARQSALTRNGKG